jgi:tRNA(Ile)-lysidine synthase
MPITSSEFSQLMAPFTPFESPPTILVATSGGPDSMALTLLANQWAVEQGGRAIAITVDHRLRVDSTEEAHQVKAWLEARGIEHHILTWERPQDEEFLLSSLQADAREARYQLLGQWCTDHNVKHLLTAHHAQDQLETFLIRLAKGSGLKGLTSTQGEVLTIFGRILRPLLKVDANRLKTTLKYFNQPYLLDPSNENEDFTRVRWRQLLPSLEAEGLTPMTLQESLERLSHSQRLIEQYVSILVKQYATFTPYGYSILKKDVLQETPEALEELLKSLLEMMRTQRYPVRRLALHRAILQMKEDQSFTLGGCQIINKTNEWWIVREPAAIRKDITVHKPGTYLWDSRFTIEVSQNTPCRIAPLGEHGIQMLEEDVKKQYKDIPHIVLQSLPALWKDADLIEPLPPFKFTPRSLIFSKKAS